MFNAGQGVAKGMKRAQSFGRNLVNGTGPVAVAMKTLGLMEHFGDIKEEIEKLENLEKRLHERMNLAEKTFANAKRSPYLKVTGSLQLLETTMEDIKEYLEELRTTGPLLRGASYEEMNSDLEMMLGWVTDALVALQLDTMLAVTNGDVDSGMPQVAPQGRHNLGDGGSSGQVVGLGNQAGDNMTGQHLQPFLMPPPTYPALPHPQQHREVVPTGAMLGTLQIPPALASQAVPRVTGAFAMPNGGARWSNNAQAVPSMMMHHTPPAIADASIGYDGAGWPNNPGTDFWTSRHTPAVVEGPIGSNGDMVSRATRQPSPADAGRENERAMWPNHGDPSSFRSLAVTGSVVSDGTMSLVPSDCASETTRKAAWVGVDKAKLFHPADSDSYATKPMYEAPSFDPNTWSRHFETASHPTHQMCSEPYDQGPQPRLSDTDSEVSAKMPGAFGPQIIYDSTGCPYYLDADTGHHYPPGWGRHPQDR